VRSTAQPARPRTAVLVSGGGTNLQAIIDAVDCGELDIDLVAVAADRPDAFGLKRAARAGIPQVAVDYADFENRRMAENELDQRLAEFSPDIVVLAGFMRILPESMVDRYLGRMLNVHPSLLPLYPGLDTYRRALAAGDKCHGSTVHFVTAELDAGPAIIQYRVEIAPDDTPESLAHRVQRGEYIVYPQAVSWLAEGRLRMIDGRAELDGRHLAAPVVVDEASS
jgi:phosphoribosylglycinamide formyltransferase-1